PDRARGRRYGRSARCRGCREDREPAPREGEAEIGVHDRHLERIKDDQRRAYRDQPEEPQTEHRRGDHAESECTAQSKGAERDEDRGWDVRSERTAAQLIERVRRDTDREKEREQ